MIAHDLADTGALPLSTFRSIAARHAYYALISRALQADAATPAALRGIRFFPAAAAITSFGVLGYAACALATGPGPLHVAPCVRSLIEAMNARLFAVNRAMLGRLLAWREPRAPIEGAHALSPLAFDLAMVDAEQREIERMLADAEHACADTSARALAGMNRLVRSATLLHRPMRRCVRWAVHAGLPTADFARYRWRVAIGRALVFSLHGKSRDAYVVHMRDGGERHATIT